MNAKHPVKKKSPPSKTAGSPEPSGKAVKNNNLPLTKRVAGLVIAVVAFLLYANTLSHQYALDDYPVIYGNSLTMKGVAGIPTMLKTAYWYGLDGKNDFLYRPLSLVTFAVEWEMAPNRPPVGHFTNVLLYALSGLLLFHFLARVFNKYNLVIPFAVTLLFIAHPLHTEVVANIKSRDELLCFLFLLISGNAFFSLAENKSWLQGVFAGVTFFIALLAKEVAITFLALFPLLLFFFREIPVKRIVLLTTLYIGVAAVYLFIRSRVLTSLTTSGDINIIDNTLVAAPDLASRLATAFYILGLYLKNLFFPVTLSSDFSYRQIPIVGFGNPVSILALLAYLAMLIYALVRMPKKDPVSFAILFYLIPLSLVANVLFLTRSTMADRFLFIPSLGFCIVVVMVLMKLFNRVTVTVNYSGLMNMVRKNGSLIGLIALVLVFYSFRTIDRNKDWKSDYTLFSKDSKVSSNSARIHFLYGNHLVQSVKQNLIDDSKKPGYLETAVVELSEAVRLYPQYLDAMFGLGELYTTQKNYPKAEEIYQQVLTTMPGDSRGLNSLGNTYLREGKQEEAFRLLSEAIKRYPDDPQGYNNIGSVYFSKQEYDKASEVYRKAIAINPVYTEAIKNLGSCYGITQQYDSAIVYFKKAIELDPYNPDHFSMLAVTYQYKGDSASAKGYFAKAQELMNSPKPR